jgi:hypothetical protein
LIFDSYFWDLFLKKPDISKSQKEKYSMTNIFKTPDWEHKLYNQDAFTDLQRLEEEKRFRGIAKNLSHTSGISPLSPIISRNFKKGGDPFSQDIKYNNSDIC